MSINVRVRIEDSEVGNMQPGSLQLPFFALFWYFFPNYPLKLFYVQLQNFQDS